MIGYERIQPLWPRMHSISATVEIMIQTSTEDCTSKRVASRVLAPNRHESGPARQALWIAGRSWRIMKLGELSPSHHQRKGYPMPAKKPSTEGPATPQQLGLDALGFPAALGSAAVEAWMNMGNEAVRFVWDRLQQDLRTQQALLACTSVEEIQKVQAEFFANAQEQYAAEAAKMLKLMGNAATSGLANPGKARRFDDVPV